MDRRFKLVLFISGGIFIVIIVLCIVNYINGIGKDVVNVVTAPKETTLLLDDNKTIKPGKHKLSTGTHTIKASFDNFEDQIKEFTTIDGQENAVWFEMEPSNEIGVNYKEAHAEEFAKIYEIANSYVIESVDKQTDDYPIIKYLPASTQSIEYNYGGSQRLSYYNDESFVINYSQSKKHPYDASKLAIYITADHPAGKFAALDYVYRLGFDPSDYEIVFETTISSSIEGGTGIGDYLDSRWTGDDEPFPEESEYIIE